MSPRYDRDDDLDGFPLWVSAMVTREDTSENNRWTCDAYLPFGAVLRTVGVNRDHAIRRACKACVGMDGQAYVHDGRGVEEL